VPLFFLEIEGMKPVLANEGGKNTPEMASGFAGRQLSYSWTQRTLSGSFGKFFADTVGPESAEKTRNLILTP
jgi:hypothetical protein